MQSQDVTLFLFSTIKERRALPVLKNGDNWDCLSVYLQFGSNQDEIGRVAELFLLKLYGTGVKSKSPDKQMRCHPLSEDGSTETDYSFQQKRIGLWCKVGYGKRCNSWKPALEFTLLCLPVMVIKNYRVVNLETDDSVWVQNMIFHVEEDECCCRSLSDIETKYWCHCLPCMSRPCGSLWNSVMYQTNFELFVLQITDNALTFLSQCKTCA